MAVQTDRLCLGTRPEASTTDALLREVLAGQLRLEAKIDALQADVRDLRNRSATQLDRDLPCHTDDVPRR